jgi:RNA polymerase sigma-70 factor (ECF subfamily)
MRTRAPIESLLSEDDFACIVDRYQRQLYAYLAGLTGQPEQAFDLVQETFYDAWDSARKGKPPLIVGATDGDIRRWLYRAATNNALSMLRHYRLIRWEPLENYLAMRADRGLSFEDHVAENDILQSALARLSPEDAACLLLRVVHGFSARLLLRVVHGFSARETGQILNASAETINTRLARAKQRLRAAYEQRLPRPSEAP